MSYKSYIKLQDQQYITYENYFRDYKGLFYAMVNIRGAHMNVVLINKIFFKYC